MKMKCRMDGFFWCMTVVEDWENFLNPVQSVKGSGVWPVNEQANCSTSTPSHAWADCVQSPTSHHLGGEKDDSAKISTFLSFKTSLNIPSGPGSLHFLHTNQRVFTSRTAFWTQHPFLNPFEFSLTRNRVDYFSKTCNIKHDYFTLPQNIA